jgi:hypothetical protein
MPLNSIKVSLLALLRCLFFSFNTRAVEHSAPAFATLSEVSGCDSMSAIKISSGHNKHVD